VSLVEVVRDAEPWLICESHSLPKMWFVGNEVVKAEREGMSLRDFFFSQDKMKEYYKTQKLLRLLVCRIMRARILRRVLGDSIAEKLPLLAEPGNLTLANQSMLGTDGVGGTLHFVTNVAVVEESTNEFLFYSEASEADMGSLVYAGPFRELIWVNKHQKATASIRAANREQAVPYDLPVRIPRSSALEAAILAHAESSAAERESYYSGIRKKKSKDDDDDEDKSRSIASSSSTDAILNENGLRVARRITHNPTVFSVKHSFIAGPSLDKDAVGAARARHAKGASCLLAWRESNLQLPVAVPDEVVDYHTGVENPGIKATLEAHGVKLYGEDATANLTLRVVIQALAPVSTMDQLVIWRAAQSALMRPQ
jgi:hypothetical protein